MTAIEKLAEQHRVHIRLDTCGDQIIPGKRGHLYYDCQQLCLMALDATGANATWLGLGGDIWTGGTWRDERNRMHQDVWIKNLPEASVKRAMRLCRIHPIKQYSEEFKTKSAAHLKSLRAGLERKAAL